MFAQQLVERARDQLVARSVHATHPPHVSRECSVVHEPRERTLGNDRCMPVHQLLRLPHGGAQRRRGDDGNPSLRAGNNVFENVPT